MTVLSVSANRTIDCLERLVSKMTYYMSSGSLNSAHSPLSSKIVQHMYKTVQPGGDKNVTLISVN